MSRISKLDPSQWEPELRDRFHVDGTTSLEQGTMRIFAHRPEIAKGVIALGAGVAHDWTLGQRLKELVRLRIAFHNHGRSRPASRCQAAVAEGVDEDLVCSLENPPAAENLSEAAKMALRYADLFATNHLRIDAEMFGELRLFFSEAQLVELGTWVAFCVGFG